MLLDGHAVAKAATGDQVEVVLPLTPFYVESGGQISDLGTIGSDDWEIQVTDVRRPVPGLIVHAGQVLRGAAEDRGPGRGECGRASPA